MDGKSDGKVMFHYLGESFFNSLKEFQNRLYQCLDDTNEVTTYSEILTWSIRTALKLKKKGITRKDIISCCSYNHKYSPIPLIATQFLGAITNVFDPRFSEIDMIYLLKLIQPKILFVDENTVQFLENCVQKAAVNTELVVFGNSSKYSQFSKYIEPEEEENSFEITKVENNTDTAIILFSSGTTGFPKGICLSHKAILKMPNDMAPYTQRPNDDVILTYSPLYWFSALIFLIRCTLLGSLSIIRINFEPVYAWKLIEKYKVTQMFLPPYYATDFLRQRPDGSNSNSLKSLAIGGCAVSKELVVGLRTALPKTMMLVGYGQTEAAGGITGFNPYNPVEYNLQLQKPDSSGKVLGGIQWKVVDVGNEKVLGPNQKGELRIKNDGYLLNGYYKMEDSDGYDSEGFWKTGDLVYYDEDECFYIVDRVKETFKYKGWHILPAVLEETLLTHPAVKEAVIIGVPHETDGFHPMGVVVLNKEYSNISEEEIEKYYNEKVTENEVLRAGVRIVETLPKTPSGKVQRKDIKHKLLNN